MKCEEVQSVTPDYLTDGLDAASRAGITGHLAECASCRSDLEGLSETWTRLRVLPDVRPSPALRAAFYTMLEEYPREMDAAPVARPSRRPSWATWTWLQTVAAAVILVVGMAAGRLSAPRVGPGASPGTGMSPVPETPLSLIRQASAGDRLKGVALASEVEHPDEALVGALLDTLDNDPNVNVRLKAAESLFLFAQKPHVRRRLSESLGRQTSPVVQIALIDLLVASREKQAAEALQELVKDRQVRPEVREHAASGVKRLL